MITNTSFFPSFCFVTPGLYGEMELSINGQRVMYSANRIPQSNSTSGHPANQSEDCNGPSESTSGSAALANHSDPYNTTTARSLRPTSESDYYSLPKEMSRDRISANQKGADARTKQKIVSVSSANENNYYSLPKEEVGERNAANEKGDDDEMTKVKTVSVSSANNEDNYYSMPIERKPPAHARANQNEYYNWPTGVAANEMNIYSDVGDGGEARLRVASDSDDHYSAVGEATSGSREVLANHSDRNNSLVKSTSGVQLTNESDTNSVPRAETVDEAPTNDIHRHNSSDGDTANENIYSNTMSGSTANQKAASIKSEHEYYNEAFQPPTG
jgi:hypothetical protein